MTVPRRIHGNACHVITLSRCEAHLEQIGVEARVQTAIEMKNVAEPFISAEPFAPGTGRVVIFAAAR